MPQQPACDASSNQPPKIIRSGPLHEELTAFRQKLLPKKRIAPSSQSMAFHLDMVLTNQVLNDDEAIPIYELKVVAEHLESSQQLGFREGEAFITMSNRPEAWKRPLAKKMQELRKYMSAHIAGAQDCEKPPSSPGDRPDEDA